MNYREENFAYTTGWSAALALAGAVDTMTILITADTSFKAYYITTAVRQGVAGAELLVGAFAGDVQIRDTAPGKTMFDAAIPLAAINGDGQLPYNFAPPRVFNANTTIEVVVTSNVGTRTQVNVTFHGAKLYEVHPMR